MIDSNTRFQVSGHNYRCGRLNAFDQNHVARKLNSILLWVAEMKKDAVKTVLPSGYAQAMCAISGSIPREDVDLAYGLCLSVVARETEGGASWAPVQTNGRLMMDDINLPEMLEIIWQVLEHNRLVDFFGAPSSTSPGSKEGERSNESGSREEKTGSSARGQRGSAPTHT